MVLFQGADAWFWFFMAIVLTVAVAAATWNYTTVGADRKPQHQKRGEETVERYGSIEEDRAPIPSFLILTYIGVAIWAIVYVLSTGILGTGL